jgi:hypothetical protein
MSSGKGQEYPGFLILEEDTMNRAICALVAVLTSLSACGQDPAFTERAWQDPGSPGSGGEGGGGPGSDDTDGDGMPDKVKKFAFGRSVKPVDADYLFVLDNSVSMVKYSQRVANGLAAIPKDSFPESSKLAVMTTMVAADPMASNLLAHPDINRTDYACIDKEPGFLELVNSDSLSRFRGCSGVRGDHLTKYALEPCKGQWFTPFEQNGSGQRCFSAAIQNPFSPVGCEAGLLALEQMLKRKGQTPLFRSNAAANVIFVSDEQEGCKAAETRGEFSSASKLVQMIKTNSSTASVKFHGIVPMSVSQGIKRYADEITATGGVVIPMDQERADYRDVIQKIIESKVDQISSQFDLGEIATEILSVEVAGQKTTDFEFDGKRIVKVRNLDSAKPTQIVIRFN